VLWPQGHTRPWSVNFRLHPHSGLPAPLPIFLLVRFACVLRVVFRPWLPYRFPRGRFLTWLRHRSRRPWLPYRFPRGGLRRATSWDPSRTARDYALSAMAVEWKDESRRHVGCVGQHDGDAGVHTCRHSVRRSRCRRAIDNGPGEVFDQEPRGLVRRTPFHAMYATRSEL
jgi:hypothetical protein